MSRGLNLSGENSYRVQYTLLFYCQNSVSNFLDSHGIPRVPLTDEYRQGFHDALNGIENKTDAAMTRSRPKDVRFLEQITQEMDNVDFLKLDAYSEDWTKRIPE